MYRRVGWLLSLLTGLTLLAPVLGQTPATPPAGEPSGGAAVFPLVVAFVFTLVILLIVCMPSRKA